jgi:hypothetical protein
MYSELQLQHGAVQTTNLHFKTCSCVCVYLQVVPVQASQRGSQHILLSGTVLPLLHTEAPVAGGAGGVAAGGAAAGGAGAGAAEPVALQGPWPVDSVWQRDGVVSREIMLNSCVSSSYCSVCANGVYMHARKHSEAHTPFAQRGALKQQRWLTSSGGAIRCVAPRACENVVV